MSFTTALAAGRRAAEAMMIDHCVVKRIPVEPIIDEEDGTERFDPEIVWEGRCKVQTYEPYEQTNEVAGHTTVSQRYSVHLPSSVTGLVEVGDVITVTGWVRDFRVAGLLHKSFQTACRLLVDEIVR